MIKTCKGNYFQFYPKNISIIYFLYYISIQPLYIQMFVLKFIYVFLRHFEIVLVEIFLYFTWQPAQWGAYFRYDVNLHFILHIMNGFHHSVLTNVLSVDIFRKCSKVELNFKTTGIAHISIIWFQQIIQSTSYCWTWDLAVNIVTNVNQFLVPNFTLLIPAKFLDLNFNYVSYTKFQIL